MKKVLKLLASYLACMGIATVVYFAVTRISCLHCSLVNLKNRVDDACSGF